MAEPQRGPRPVKLAPRIRIGGFTLRGEQFGELDGARFQADARAEADFFAATWLVQTAPGPHRAFGYVMHSNAQGAELYTYRPLPSAAAEEEMLAKTVGLWTAARDMRAIAPGKQPTDRIHLGLTVFEGLRVDLYLTATTGDVVLKFRDLDPEDIGYVSGLGGPRPATWNPLLMHADWSTEAGRPADLIGLAADHYDRRPGPG